MMANHATGQNRYLGSRGPDTPLLRRETLWWVELRHPDPQRSVPLWASYGDHAQAAARRAPRGFAHRLDLPTEA